MVLPRGNYGLYFEDGGMSMRKLELLVLVVCVGLFAMGCEKPKAKPVGEPGGDAAATE